MLHAGKTIDNKQHLPILTVINLTTNNTPLQAAFNCSLVGQGGLGLAFLFALSLSLRASSFANVLVLVRAVTRMNWPNQRQEHPFLHLGF